MTQPENNDGNSAVQLTHVTRTYKRDEFEVRALDDVPHQDGIGLSSARTPIQRLKI